MRRKVIAGNWKMNMLPNEAIACIEQLASLVKDTENEVILCVPYTDLFYSLLTAQGTNIKIGAQNMHFEEKAAFTFLLTVSSVSAKYCLLSECPIITYSTPMHLSIGPETSPVNAPFSSKCIFCAPILMFVPCAVSKL